MAVTLVFGLAAMVVTRDALGLDEPQDEPGRKITDPRRARRGRRLTTT